MPVASKPGSGGKLTRPERLARAYDRLITLIENDLAEFERKPEDHSPAQHEKSARTLGTLTATLERLVPLIKAALPSALEDDDALRQALQRRLADLAAACGAEPFPPLPDEEGNSVPPA